MAAVVNAYHIYNIKFCHEKFRQISHLDFNTRLQKVSYNSAILIVTKDHIRD